MVDVPVVETKSANVFSSTKVLNCLGLCSAIVNLPSRNGQDERNPRDKNEQSSATHQDDRIQVMEQRKRYQKQLKGHVRKLPAALQDRTQRRPTFETVWVSPSFRDDDAQLPWVDNTVEKCWNLASMCWLICLRREKIGKPRSETD